MTNPTIDMVLHDAELKNLNVTKLETKPEPERASVETTTNDNDPGKGLQGQNFCFFAGLRALHLCHRQGSVKRSSLILAKTARAPNWE